MFNNGTLLNVVLTPKLDNSPSASCSLINLDFLLSHDFLQLMCKEALHINGENLT